MKMLAPLLACLVFSAPVHSSLVFFISDRPAQNPAWNNCCPQGVCMVRNMFQAPGIDYRYNFGYSYPPGKITADACHSTQAPNTIVESPAFLQKLSESLKESEGRVIVFVHGYNVDFQEGLTALRSISTSLDFPTRKGVPLLFSWNSAGSMSHYTSDEEYSRLGGIGLSHTLRALARLDAVSEIHLIAHSMGNRVAVDGLERASWMLEEELPVGKDAIRDKFRSIAYFASDLSVEEHMVKTARIQDFFPRIKGAVFFSDRDAALKASKHVHLGVQRAGQTSSGLTYCEIGPGPTVVKKVVVPSIDASILGPNLKDVLGHSYILRSPVLRDHLSHLLFNTPFRPESHYRKVVPEGPFTRVSASLGCESEIWVLPRK
jgi:esterase/lipase superfamily enzyme